jgi:hypothetical protein
MVQDKEDTAIEADAEMVEECDVADAEADDMQEQASLL